MKKVLKIKGGFSLTELIVVVAILAVLAVLATMAYSGFVQSAQRANVNTNANNLATQLNNYNAQSRTPVTSIPTATSGHFTVTADSISYLIPASGLDGNVTHSIVFEDATAMSLARHVLDSTVAGGIAHFRVNTSRVQALFP